MSDSVPVDTSPPEMENFSVAEPTQSPPSLSPLSLSLPSASADAAKPAPRFKCPIYRLKPLGPPDSFETIVDKILKSYNDSVSKLWSYPGGSDKEREKICEKRFKKSCKVGGNTGSFAHTKCPKEAIDKFIEGVETKWYRREVPNNQLADDLFTIQLCVKVTEGRDEFLTHVAAEGGRTYPRQSYSSVLFFAHQLENVATGSPSTSTSNGANEIFCLTSGAGRAVISDWVDYDFPQRLALRSDVLEKNTANRPKLLNLLTNDLLTEKVHRTDVSLAKDVLGPYKLPIVCRSYTAAVANSDLLSILEPFSKTRRIKLNPNDGSVTFQTSLDFSTYKKIFLKLPHLVSKSSGDTPNPDFVVPLRMIQGDIDEDEALLQKLDESLFETLWRQLTEGGDKVLLDWDIVPKDLKNFFKANWARLQTPKISLQEAPPTLVHILQVLKKECHSGGNCKLLKDKKKFQKKFQNIILSFGAPGKTTGKFKLFKALQGTLTVPVNKDGEQIFRTCWLFNGSWYRLDSSFVVDVEVGFRQFLQTSLLRDDDPDFLALFWPNTKDIEKRRADGEKTKGQTRKQKGQKKDKEEVTGQNQIKKVRGKKQVKSGRSVEAEQIKEEVTTEDEVTAEVTAKNEVKAEVTAKNEVKAEVTAKNEVKVEVTAEKQNEATARVKAENIFNKNYSGQDGFYVGDERLTKDLVEICDLLKIRKVDPEEDELEAIIYHNKEGWGQATREVTAQILASAKIINDGLNTHNLNGGLKEMFQSTSFQESKLAEEYSQDRIRKALWNKTTFVYGVKTTNSRLFKEDINRPCHFTVENIWAAFEGEVNKNFFDDLSNSLNISGRDKVLKAIQDNLVENNYADEVGSGFRFTTKWLHVTQDSFEFTPSTNSKALKVEHRKKLCKILRDYMSPSFISKESICPKIGVLELQRALRALRESFVLKMTQIRVQPEDDGDNSEPTAGPSGLHLNRV